MKNIYYISNMFPSEKKNDNYGIFCKNVFDNLPNNDVTIILLSVIRGKSFKKFFNLIRYLILEFDIYRKIIFYIHKFDIIYFQYVWLHVFLALPLFPYLHKHDKKIVLNFHGEDLLEFVANCDKKKYKRILNHADLIVLPSGYFKEKLTTVFTISNQKILISPSGGVNEKIFKYSKKKYLGYKLVFCSRFVPQKRWIDFIETVLLLKKRGINVSGTMIGYGPDFNSIKEKIHLNSLDSVIQVKINLSQEQIVQEYLKSDLFLFTTAADESFGLVGIEAMACGLPVIGTNISALREYILDGVNGYLVELKSPEQLASKVEHYFSLSDKERRSLIKNARLTAMQYKQKIVIDVLRKKLLELQ